MSFSMIMQLILSGIALGFIYSMVSIEYTLIFNSTGLLNFSHDKLIMLGAYIFAGQFALRMGCGYVISTIATILSMFIIGVLMAKGIFNPMRNMASPIFAVIGTVVMGRIIKELCRIIWGATAFNIPGFMKGTFRIGNVMITRANTYIIIVAVLLVIALQLYFNHSRSGKAMRCVQQNKTAATLMGINVSQNINITIGISAVVCSIIGILVISLFSVSLTMTNMIGIKGFAAGVIGGFGYFPGCIVGGVLIGILENLSTLAIPSVYKDCVAFVLMIVFLLVRPNGILGHKK